MQNFYASSPDIYALASMQHFGWHPLKEFIGIYIISVRQITSVNYILFDLFQGLGKSAVKPLQFRFVGIKIRIILMSANMIPVNMINSY